MRKYLLLSKNNLILNATFSRTKKEGWLEVEDLEPITEKIYSTYYENGVYRFDEELYKQYLIDKKEREEQAQKEQEEQEKEEAERYERERAVTKEEFDKAMVEINSNVSSVNTYKTAYLDLTDGVDVETVSTMKMRSNIQALFVSADSTSIVNAEPFVDEWVAGTMEQPIEYKIGDVRKEQGQVYECKQAHTHHGEEGWNPSTFKAGWIVKHTKDKTNPKPYIQPQGAHDAYMKDECVSWNGKVYVSKVDNNVYSPTDYAQNWKVVE